MFRQGDVPRIEEWQEIAKEIRLGRLANLVVDTLLTEWLFYELPP
jgi:hypothetical protein